MMGEHMIYLKLKYVFLLLIIFILDPELFIIGLQLSVLRLQLLIWELQLSCALTIMDVYIFFKSKTTPELELYSNVNNATIVTSYDNPVKCVTVIIHPAFNKEDLLIVEEYKDEMTAKAGHEKWEKIFDKWLPKELKDAINNTIYKREYFE